MRRYRFTNEPTDHDETMHAHVSFQATRGPRGTWVLMVTWNHMLRERILGLEFALEDEALCWIKGRARHWLSFREPSGPAGGDGTYKYVVVNDGGEFISVRERDHGNTPGVTRDVPAAARSGAMLVQA